MEEVWSNSSTGLDLHYKFKGDAYDDFLFFDPQHLLY